VWCSIVIRHLLDRLLQFTPPYTDLFLFVVVTIGSVIQLTAVRTFCRHFVLSRNFLNDALGSRCIGFLASSASSSTSLSSSQKLGFEYLRESVCS
jgi:hypothetical protein